MLSSDSSANFLTTIPGGVIYYPKLPTISVNRMLLPHREVYNSSQEGSADSGHKLGGCVSNGCKKYQECVSLKSMLLYSLQG